MKMNSRDQSEISGGKVNAILIMDIVGRPPEHLVETLKKMMEEMENEKGITVLSKKIKEPTLIKDQKEFYTTFAEIEIESEDILGIAILMFKYMPAHVEILSPEILAMSNNGFNDILNELIRKLHAYDEIARIMQIENKKLIGRVKELEDGSVKKEDKDETSMKKTKKRGKKKAKK